MPRQASPPAQTSLSQRCQHARGSRCRMTRSVACSSGACASQTTGQLAAQPVCWSAALASWNALRREGGRSRHDLRFPSRLEPRAAADRHTPLSQICTRLLGDSTRKTRRTHGEVPGDTTGLMATTTRDGKTAALRPGKTMTTTVSRGAFQKLE